ncbi:bifunctional acetate--CoA ligase family protein/GNAT family N-acetyltransferase [Candidatus Thiosymbion oneisti]|uniref:bifunctional acetate--CoA ligase family protein/GNAT family N-acetyltransferase n=1 Tax=Candidatus Thiosymbion oneisti TaxID=589554 RepID=UPI000A6431B8|nr:bifunctional acetate--CoA ligase family protein/GNAT family N-acetyltransferase [Candidatus Thiosymbion oneisti]
MTPELAIIGTPPEPVPSLVSALGKRGTRAAIVLTVGMSGRCDEQGETTLEAMLEAARPYNLRILGPNSSGLVIPEIGLNASFFHRSALPGKIAFVSQSGGMCTGILDWASAKGIGFSHFIALGECADVGFAEVIDFLSIEPSTRAILVFMKTLVHSRGFMSAARAAARNKPVLIVKATGHPEATSIGSAPARTRVRSDAVYAAAFRRAGMLQVQDTEELFAAVETLARSGPLRSDDLTIMTNSDGTGIRAVDSLNQGGGSLTRLTDATLEQLDALLPMVRSHGNPVNIRADATGERYADVLRILVAAQEVDTILVLHTPTAVTSGMAAAEAVVRVVSETGGNVLTCWIGGETALPARNLFAQAGIPSYGLPGIAVRAFLHRVRYRQNQELLIQTPPSVPRTFVPATDVAQDAVRKTLAAGKTVMADPEAKVVLAAYGLSTVPTRIAGAPAQAAQLAASLGFPVAVKLLSPDIANRSDVGGVVLDLDTPQAVVEAEQRIRSRLRRLFPKAQVAGFSVQKMVQRPGGQELMAGVVSDPVFGPVILFGQGGSAADVIGDLAVALPPLNMHLARELMSRTRIHNVLRGYHGHKAANIDAICLTLVKLSHLIVDIPPIADLLINPLFADDQEVLAVETSIRLWAESPPFHHRLAIRPYPQVLEEDFALRTGPLVQLRPIRPEDEPEHAVFFAKLRPEDIQLRFFGSFSKFQHPVLARFTQIDYDREMAFIATAPDAGGKPETLGEVRTIADPDNLVAEYSIIVRSDLKGTGLGRKLMSKMIDYCRSRGIRKLTGHVLCNNPTMLAMIGAMGFHRKISPDDPEVFETWLDLQEE